MRILKNIGYFVFLAALVAGGWYMRGMIPSNPSMGGPPGMGGTGAPGAGAPQVTVDHVGEVSQTPVTEYVGHVKAIQDVDIYAQISGTIRTVHFREGSLVKKEDLLFSIDPQKYEAQVRVEEASVMQAKAQLESAKADLAYARTYMKRLKTAEARSVAKTDRDKAQSDLLVARAALEKANAQLGQAKADLEVARIDLGYTKILSPIDGKIGQAELTCGDYVSPGAGVLASIVQTAPVRVRFALSDRDFMQIKADSTLADSKVQLKLPNGTEFSETGTLDFFGNQMDAATGTIDIFFRFDNAGGMLVPETYVTVQMSSQVAGSALTVSQKAVMTDEKGEYVYVLNKESIVEKRSVTLGDLAQDRRIVLSGLAPSEQVIVQGLQKVKPGQKAAVAARSETAASVPVTSDASPSGSFTPKS
jgi:RND family efflux transporter MFP subunit